MNVLLFIGQLLLLSLSFVLSTAAAALFLTLALYLAGDVSWLNEDAAVWIGGILFAFVAWFAIAASSFGPFLVLVIILEVGRLTGFVVNLIAGGLCALAAFWIFQNRIAAP